MATFKLTKKPRSPNILHHEIRAEVVKALKPVAKAHVDSRAKVVENWENKPKFKAETKVTPNKIEIIVTVRRGARLKGNSGATVNDLWKWLDQTGTRAHPITPKQQGGALQFQAGKYQSKTGANPARYGGPGTVQNPTEVFAKRIKEHPGFPARHFTEAINQDLKKDFDNAVRNGYRRGFKKVGR